MVFYENQLKQKRSDRKCKGCAELADNKNRLKKDVYVCNLVGGCQRVLAVNFFNAKEVANFNARGGKLWCKDCVEQTQEQRVYACNLAGGCERVLGKQCFEQKQLENFNDRGGKLWCKDCIEKQKEKNAT